MVMSRTKLKLCPFCSGKAKIHYDYSNFALVQCSKCGIGTLHKPNEVDAVKDWNTRKPMDKVVEQLEDELRYISLIEGLNYMEFKEAIDVVKAGGIDE
jgi:Zn ribbon nucleic-acid-binding protein